MLDDYNNLPLQNAEDMGRKGTQLVIATFLIMTCLAISQNKITPLMTSLMSYWDIKESSIGVLQSAQSWVTIFLLIPVGIFIKRFPPRIICFCSVGLMIIGGAIGMLAISFPMLIAGRVVEGLGAASTDMFCQLIISTNFTRRRTTALGVINCGNMLSQVINLNVAPKVLEIGTWKSVYLYTLCYQILIFIIWMALVDKRIRVGGDSIVRLQHTAKVKLLSQLKPMKNRNLWLIALAGACFGCCATQFGSYVPTYLTTRGMSLSTATRTYSYTIFFGMIAFLLSGIICDYFKNKRKVAAVAMYAYAGILLLLRLPISYIYVFIIFAGLVPRMSLPCANSAIPDLYKDRSDAAIGQSCSQLTTSLIGMLGSIGIGYLIEHAGYNVTIFCMMGVAFLGGTCWLLQRGNSAENTEPSPSD